MNWHWLFNGTLQAHHLLAVYVLVWVVQGGYAVWVAREMTRSRRKGQ